MSIVLWFAATPEGRAALERAVAEAAGKSRTLVVVPVSGAQVGEAQELARVRGVDVEVRHPEEGRTTTDEVLDLSYEEGIDSVVIGVRRRSPVGKLLLGSAAQQLILEAGCPVLAVKPPVGGQHG